MEETGPLTDYPSAPDQALVARAQAGNQQALATLYVRYRRKILNYAYRFVGDREMAEELTQETFVKVVEHLPRYRPTGSVAGWIYRIAHTTALHTLRDRRTHRAVSLDEPVALEDGAAVDRAEAIPNQGPKPDEEAAAKERERAVQRQLERLPTPYLQAVILCDLEGYSYRQASEMLRCPINTVASRVARGRALLATRLGFLHEEIA